MVTPAALTKRGQDAKFCALPQLDLADEAQWEDVLEGTEALCTLEEAGLEEDSRSPIHGGFSDDRDGCFGGTLEYAAWFYETDFCEMEA